MTATITDPTTGLSTRELETELLGLAGNLAAAQCRFLQLLAEFDRRQGWAGPGLKSCAHWLCWRIGMSLRTATEHLRVAHALTRLPKITQASAAGRISYSKVRAITRVTGKPAPDASADPTAGSPGEPAARQAAGRDADDTARPEDSARPKADTKPETEDEPGPDAIPNSRSDRGGPTVRVASNSNSDGNSDSDTPEPRPEIPALADDAEQVLLDLALAGTASHVEKVVRATRRAQADPTRATALRSVTWHYDQDGSLVLRGRFTPHDGARLVATIEALLAHPQPVTHPVPDPPQGWQDTGREQAPGAVHDRIAARRADALLALVTATTGEQGPEIARDRAQVVVHIEASTGTARIEDGPEIPAATAERIACDADIQLLLHDPNHNRLYLSRRRRLATPAQIAALTVRDGPGCQFPGCNHTRHLHAHHVQHWLHGGRTDPDNLLLLCSFHHRLLHDLGYGVHREDQQWLFNRPDNTPVPQAGAALDGNTESLLEINTRAQLKITRDSLTPSWGGERLDPTPILQRLLPHRRRAAA